MTRAPFRLFALIAALCGLCALAAPAARADVVVDVNQGVLQPMPIAVPAFGGAAPYASDISKVISADLARSGLFRPLDPSGFATRRPT